MSRFWTIFRREFASYFNSAMGYVFIVVFQLVASMLFVTRFFDMPYADMRHFFGLAPIIMCVFIPLVTMRLWAEDRKENTYELLLTFPMPASTLVLGKFFAGLAFFVLALVSTAVIPIMLGILGRPDWGQIVTAYLGTALLGGMFLALGLTISGFCKDQIVAAVLTVLACFGLYLVGTDFVAGALDTWWDSRSVGTFLKNFLGVTNHHDTFVRGVIEVADVLYFMVWIALFLALNGMYIQSRFRPGAKVAFAVGLVLCLGIGVGFNAVIADISLGRFDNTEGKIYSLSGTTQTILEKLDVPVRVTYYVTPSGTMPTDMKGIERDVTDRLKEIAMVSDGKLDYRVVHMQAANILRDRDALDGDAADSLERQMLEKGLEPIPRAVEEGAGIVQVYSALGIAYKDRAERFVPRLTPEVLPELEYMLMSEIVRAVPERKPVVVVVAPIQQVPPYMQQLYMQMGQPMPPAMDDYETIVRILEHQGYEVVRLPELGPQHELPEAFDALVAIEPVEWGPRHLWEISRILRSGTPVFMAVQYHEWNYNPRDGAIMRRDGEPGVAPLLTKLGASIEPRVMMDVVTSPFNAMRGILTIPNVPIQIVLIEENMNPDHPITQRMPSVNYTWGSAIALDDDILKEHGLQAAVLLRSTAQAWLSRAGNFLSTDDMRPPATGLRSYPAAVDVSGQFPDVYAGQRRPEWPDVPGQPPYDPEFDEPATPVTPAPGRLILTGSAEMFRDHSLGYGSYMLLINSIDSMVLGDDLLAIRGKAPAMRRIGSVSSRGEIIWKFVHYVGVAALVAALGLTNLGIRRQRRKAYEQRVRQGAA